MPRTGPEPALVEYPFSYKLKPVLRRVITERETPIIVDGHTSDWRELNYHFERAEGAVKMDFDLCYDDAYIYVAARVYDENVQSFGKGPTWKQDNLSIMLNANKASQSALSVGYEWYLFDFVQQLSPETDSSASVAYRDNLPAGTKMFVRATEYG